MTVENYQINSKQDTIQIDKPIAHSASVHGKWERVYGYATPGGDPVFRCSRCHGSEHIYGVEHSEKKMVCDECGSINSYTW